MRTTVAQYDNGGGAAPGGWWFPHRELPNCCRPGTYCVSLGVSWSSDPDAESWCANFNAVVDDFGTLRKVPE